MARSPEAIRQPPSILKFVLVVRGLASSVEAQTSGTRASTSVVFLRVPDAALRYHDHISIQIWIWSVHVHVQFS